MLAESKKLPTFAKPKALSPGGGMVDALVSGASVERRAGSSPVLGTIKSRNSLKIKSCGISLLFLSAKCLQNGSQ